MKTRTRGDVYIDVSMMHAVQTPQKHPIPQRTKDLPATVTIAAGQERRLEIKIDTGRRAR